MSDYSQDNLANAVARNARGELGMYGKLDDWLRQLITTHVIHPYSVLLVGSTEQGFGPWYEGMLLALGFPTVQVTDYNRNEYDGSLQVGFVPYPVDPPMQFDNIVCVSSIEHSGLGLYGDLADHDGDLNEMARLRSVLRRDGLLFLTVPLGVDEIAQRTHRVYGRERLPKLLSGFTLIDSLGFEESMLDRPAKFEWDLDVSQRSEMPETSAVLVLRKE